MNVPAKSDAHETDVRLIEGLYADRLDIGAEDEAVLAAGVRQIVAHFGNADSSALSADVRERRADQAGCIDDRSRRREVHRSIEQLSRDAHKSLIGQIRRDEPGLTENPRT